MTALAEELAVSVDTLTITSGVRASALALGVGCARALVECPGFAPIPQILARAGANVILREWDSLCTEPLAQGDLAWVTSPLRNPDGASLSPTHYALLGRAAERGARVVRNEVYRWYAPAENDPPGMVRVGSLSKLVGGGARLGWVAGELSHELLRVLGPPTAWQLAWGDFLSAVGVAPLVATFVAPVLEARARFLDVAQEVLGHTRVGPGPYLSLKVAGVDERRAVAVLRDAGVSVGPGVDFLAPRPCVRLAFTGISVKQACLAGERVARVVHAHPDLLRW